MKGSTPCPPKRDWLSAIRSFKPHTLLPLCFRSYTTRQRSESSATRGNISTTSTRCTAICSRRRPRIPRPEPCGRKRERKNASSASSPITSRPTNRGTRPSFTVLPAMTTGPQDWWASASCWIRMIRRNTVTKVGFIACLPKRRTLWGRSRTVLSNSMSSSLPPSRTYLMRRSMRSWETVAADVPFQKMCWRGYMS